MFEPQGGLPFVGIPTFGRVPHIDLWGTWSADAAVLGVPYDFGVGFRPGARFGPRAIREASMRYAISSGPMWVGDADVVLYEGTKVVDVGDVDIVQLEYRESFQRIKSCVVRVVERGAVPVILGGDHSITYPVLCGMEQKGPFYIVQFDAHLDFLEARSGTRFSNSSPFRRAAELPYIEGITTVGLRGLRTSPSAYQSALERGNKLIWAHEIHDLKLDSVLQKLPQHVPVYVTIDIDVLDSSVAPGTGSPEPGGLSFRTLQQMLRWVTVHNSVVGFDIVEVSPMVDTANATSITAAQLAVEFLGWILRQNKNHSV